MLNDELWNFWITIDCSAEDAGGLEIHNIANTIVYWNESNMAWAHFAILGTVEMDTVVRVFVGDTGVEKRTERRYRITGVIRPGAKSVKLGLQSLCEFLSQRLMLKEATQFLYSRA